MSVSVKGATELKEESRFLVVVVVVVELVASCCSRRVGVSEISKGRFLEGATGGFWEHRVYVTGVEG
jgi:hypothetical protein